MVMPGYKQTEIGVLPDSWDTITFEECFTILPNNTLSRAELNYNGGEVQNIHYGDILVKFPAVLDCSTEGLPYINKENVSKASKGFLRDGDLIMADTAEDVIVGKSTEVIGIGDSKIVSGLHTIPCRPRDAEMFAPKWLGYFINYCTYHDQLIPYITGIKVSSVSKSAISSTVIAVPPKPEQEAIAEALTDIDTLIVNLEKLISKKRAIKQGAMQELLTGRRRLPGFDGEWKEAAMDLYVDFQVGFPFSSAYFNSNSDGLRLVKNRDLKSDDQVYFTSEPYATEYVVENDDILIGMDGDFLPCRWQKGKALLNQRVGRLLPKKNLDVLFAYYALQKPLAELQNGTGATTVKHLSHGDIKKLIVLMPPTKEEQSAIAEILSDVDLEIEQLQLSLVKYMLVKQGMMSELLTGRIRLV